MISEIIGLQYYIIPETPRKNIGQMSYFYTYFSGYCCCRPAGRRRRTPATESAR